MGRDGLAGLACLAASLILLGMTRGLPQPALVPIGPGFYPGIVFGVTAVLGAALLVSDLLRGHRPRAPAGHYRLVALTFAIFIAYVAALPWLGFRVATFLFVGGLQAALEPPGQARHWGRLLAVAALTAAVTYLVFERYLTVLLPRGRLTGF